VPPAENGPPPVEDADEIAESGPTAAEVEAGKEAMLIVRARCLVVEGPY
jgi:hypothetical protein